MSQSIPGKPVFPALPRLSSRGSTHTTVARGTALWESLVGKPRGKAWRESYRSPDRREGKRNPAATAREESARACPTSRRGLTPLMRNQKFHTPLRQLKKFPDIPVSTREEARESRHIQRSLVSASWLERRDPFTAWSGKNSRHSHRISRWRSPKERGEELQGRATIPGLTQMSQSIPQEPVFPALPWPSCRGSTHTTVTRGTDLLESLVGKTRGKAIDPLVQAWGSVTLLLQHGRKGHAHAPTRDEA